MRRSLMVIGAAGFIALVVVAGFALTRDGHDETSTTTTGLGFTEPTSPYDLTEAGADVDLRSLVDAKFASLLLETAEGQTSYMIAAGQPSFEGLAQAVSTAKKTDDPPPATGSFLAFVMDDRTTVTFEIDAEEGLLTREGVVWKPDGDLAALVAAVTARADGQ